MQRRSAFFGAFTGAFRVPVGAAGAAAAVSYAPQRDTYATTLIGASTTQGNQDDTGITPGTLIAAMPGTASVRNLGVGGSFLADVLGAGQAGAMTAPEKDGAVIAQFETNSINLAPIFGRGWLHAEVYRVQFVNAGKITADCIAGKRHLVWMGADGNASAAYSARYEQFVRYLWNIYPGCVVDLTDYWTQAPALDGGGADEAAFRNNGKAPSYQTPALDHPNGLGYTWMHTSHRKAWVEAINGGVPFVLAHRYYATASTAQTNGGQVCEIAYTGNAAGCTWSVLNRDGSTNADFALSMSGATLNLVRSSAAIIKLGLNELFIRVTRAADSGVQTYRIRLCISGEHAAPTRALYDANFAAYLDTNHLGAVDGNGLPTFSTGTTRQWDAAVSAPGTEMSFVIDITPLLADDGRNMWIIHGTASFGIQRLTTNAVRVFAYDGETGTTIGTITTTAIINGAGGRRWLF
jgi:hypothetical protein